MNAKTLSRSAVAVAVAVALSAGYVAGHRDVPTPQIISPAQAAAMMPAEAAAKTGIPDFSGLVETYGPAVVNISAKHVVKQTALRGGESGGIGTVTTGCHKKGTARGTKNKRSAVTLSELRQGRGEPEP